MIIPCLLECFPFCRLNVTDHISSIELPHAIFVAIRLFIPNLPLKQKTFKSFFPTHNFYSLSGGKHNTFKPLLKRCEFICQQLIRTHSRVCLLYVFLLVRESRFLPVLSTICKTHHHHLPIHCCQVLCRC